MKKLFILILVFSAIACQQKGINEAGDVVAASHDVHSFARPLDAVVKHLDLDIKVDFEKKLISGKASWSIDNPSKGDSIIFDTRDLGTRKPRRPSPWGKKTSSWDRH
jgi:leukotriene-A4 hydrolase